MKTLPTPSPSRSSSSSSFNLTSVSLSSVKLPTLKNPFFQQNKLLDTIQDHQLFRWSYPRAVPLEGEENSGFLGIGHFFSKSGATTPTFLSRSSSFSATVVEEEIVLSDKIEDVYHIKKDE